MKSNVCKIETGIHDQEAIFQELEKVAVYNSLTHKQMLQMRLLCEEIDGMLPWIIGDFNGQLWFEFENGVCKVNVSVRVPDLTSESKENLIELSRNKTNAAAVGVIGKIRTKIEDFLLAEEPYQQYVSTSQQFHLSTGFSEGVDYYYLWSLEQYRNAGSGDEQAAEWDELEKSVIASVADDVIVGVRGKQVEIVVVKNFA